jgi:hypothetical protein
LETKAEPARINYEILALDEAIATQLVEKRVIFRDRTRPSGQETEAIDSAALLRMRGNGPCDVSEATDQTKKFSSPHARPWAAYEAAS